MVAEGLQNAEVASQLCVTANTVETHLKHVYHKLGVRSRTAATRVLIPGLEANTMRLAVPLAGEWTPGVVEDIHELNTHLTLAVGYAELAASQEWDPAEARLFAEEAFQAAVAASRLLFPDAAR